MRTLPWWLATPRATTLVRDPLEAEGSPKYLAPTRPFQGTGVLGGASGAIAAVVSLGRSGGIGGRSGGGSAGAGGGGRHRGSKQQRK